MKKIKKVKERFCIPDLLYNSSEISKFINVMMISGKKTVSRKMIYKAFNYIYKKFKKNPIYVFSIAIDNVSPLIEIKIKRTGNLIHNTAVEIRNSKRISLAMRWIKKSSRLRRDKYMHVRLANELIDAFEKKGKTVKKKDEIHKVCESNRAYFNVNLKIK